MTTLREALRLADRLESDLIRSQTMLDAAAELRRLSAVEAQRDALLEALKPMIDLAEFWIDHRQERRMSEREYKVWMAFGYESNAMRKARAAIAAVEETK
jgi:hypothetical protein